MAYNYTKKIYTIPLTNYTSGNRERHNFRIVVLRGGTRPQYVEDGYGSGTSHTVAEIFEYLKTWGVEPTDLTPGITYSSASDNTAIVPEVYAETGHLAPFKQTRTTPLQDWVPNVMGNWEYGRYTIDKSPYLGNAQSQTPPYCYIYTDTENADTQRRARYKASRVSGTSNDTAFAYTELGIMWLPQGFEVGQNQSDSRFYLLRTSGGSGNCYLSHETGIPLRPAMMFYWMLVWGGDIQDYEGTGEDPYSPGGTSEGGVGGHGNFDMSSDTIGVPALPTLSAVDLGLVSVFKPDKAQAQALGNFLWNPSNIWDDVKKVVADPIQTILGFSILPYTPDTGANPVVVKLGNMSSGVSMLPVSNQYKEIDCGTLTIKEFWGSCLDYSPYTKTHMYLPYVGIVPIDIDDIMGKELHVVYHCDCLSGACIAYILSNGSQIACYEGQVSAQIPIASNDYSNLVSSAISAVGAGLTLAVSGGATAPAAVPALAGAAVNALKPNVQKSGTLAGMGGIMTTQFPFLIAQRPRQCVPSDYNKMGGYPSYITATLADCTGFTKVSDVHLQVATATEEEKREIEELLKAGVLI